MNVFSNVLDLFHVHLKRAHRKRLEAENLVSKWANQIPSTCDGNSSRLVTCEAPPRGDAGWSLTKLWPEPVRGREGSFPFCVATKPRL